MCKLQRCKGSSANSVHVINLRWKFSITALVFVSRKRRFRENFCLKKFFFFFFCTFQLKGFSVGWLSLHYKFHEIFQYNAQHWVVRKKYVVSTCTMHNNYAVLLKEMWQNKILCGKFPPMFCLSTSSEWEKDCFQIWSHLETLAVQVRGLLWSVPFQSIWLLGYWCSFFF